MPILDALRANIEEAKFDNEITQKTSKYSSDHAQ
jgi:hypothetical protein